VLPEGISTNFSSLDDAFDDPINLGVIVKKNFSDREVQSPKDELDKFIKILDHFSD